MLQGSLKQRLAGLLAAGAVAAAIVAGSAAPASAHAALVGTDPEDGAALAEAPESVSATFSELLDPPSTEIAVTDPSGETVELDAAEFDGDTFVQPMRYTTPGEYTVAFRVISEDGHRVDGSLAFTVESIPDELAVGGADSEPTEPATTDEAVEEPSEQPTEEAAAQDEEESDSGTALAMILLAALVVVIGGVLLVKFLGRRSGGASDQ